jgi:hypothetical protein
MPKTGATRLKSRSTLLRCMPSGNTAYCSVYASFTCKCAIFGLPIFMLGKAENKGCKKLLAQMHFSLAAM